MSKYYVSMNIISPNTCFTHISSLNAITSTACPITLPYIYIYIYGIYIYIYICTDMFIYNYTQHTKLLKDVLLKRTVNPSNRVASLLGTSPLTHPPYPTPLVPPNPFPPQLFVPPLITVGHEVTNRCTPSCDHSQAHLLCDPLLQLAKCLTKSGLPSWAQRAGYHLEHKERVTI